MCYEYEPRPSLQTVITVVRNLCNHVLQNYENTENLFFRLYGLILNGCILYLTWCGGTNEKQKTHKP